MGNSNGFDFISNHVYRMIIETLQKLQKAASIPKSESGYNNTYKYRTVDAIIARIKPILDEEKAVIILTDTVEYIGDRFYIKSTAILKKGELTESATGWSREPNTMAKMAEPQVTGAATTYARKSALGALLLIDDGDDPDDPQFHQDELKQTQRTVRVDNIPPKQPINTPEEQPKQETAGACSSCGLAINQKVLEYSTQKFSKPLCYNCQKQ